MNPFVASLPLTSRPRENRIRPWSIMVTTEALGTLRRVLNIHLGRYARHNSTGLLIPFKEEELHLLWACLPETGGNVVLTRETIQLLGHYALYLTRQTQYGVQTLLPGSSSLLVARDIREVLYATVSPTRITFQLC